MNTYTNAAALGYGRAMAATSPDRRSFPATDNIAIELDALIRRMHDNNAVLDDIADRTVGCPPPENPSTGLDVAPGSIADRVRMLDLAIARYESLLARF